MEPGDDRCRAGGGSSTPATRIVVAVDPAGAAGEDADETGIHRTPPLKGAFIRRFDMRKGMNGLALQVQQGLGRDPHAGDL